MKVSRFIIAILTILIFVPSVHSASLLIHVERKSSSDLDSFLSKRFSVVQELEFSLLLRGDAETMKELKKMGYESSVLDEKADSHEHYLVNLRPDSSELILLAKGDLLSLERNLLLFTVPKGTSLVGIDEAKVFIGPLSKRGYKLSRQKTPPIQNRSRAAIPIVQDIVNDVSTAGIDSTWSQLVVNPPTGTRNSTSQGCRDAADYAYDFFEQLGLDVTYQNYNPSHAPNVIATQYGRTNPDNVYIIVGHLDDMPSSGAAPGADDNASGSVHVLEAARALSCYFLNNTVKYILVTGEEYGLYGSEAYSNDALGRNENILGVINMDMPGWAGDGLPASGENLDLNYNSASQWLGEHYARCATEYGTGLVVDAFLCPSLNASDHYPFWSNGYDAICGITDNEGYCSHNGSYGYYHTSNDTIANCGNPAFFYSTIKASIAALGELAEPVRLVFGGAASSCNGLLTIRIKDGDLNTNTGSQQSTTALVWSSSELTPEPVILTEEGNDSSLFSGTITLTTPPASPADGNLSVVEGDTVSASYDDSSVCGHSSVSRTYTASIPTDCTIPTISGVSIDTLTHTSATILWSTNEAANSRIEFGESVPPGQSMADPFTYSTLHSLTLTGLSPCTTYVFRVISDDSAGNRATDDNGGAFFSFKTQGWTSQFGPDDVESGAGSWTVSGQWHIDSCSSSSPDNAWKAGSATCPGTYNASLTSSLTSSPISLGAGGASTFTFDEYYVTESGYDWCYLEISTNDGQNWSTLEDRYAGTNGSWQTHAVDLSSYSGDIRIRFRMTTDSSENREGWYVDNIEIGFPQWCGPQLEKKSESFVDSCSGTGVGGGNGRVDAGERLEIDVLLQNVGTEDAADVAGTLSCPSPLVTIQTESAQFGTVSAGGTASSESPYILLVDKDAPCGTILSFSLEVTDGTDTWTEPLTLIVGEVQPGTSTPVNESFEGSFPPTGWTVFETADTSGPGWQRGMSGTSGSNGGGPHSGTYYAWNNDDDLTTSATNWLVLPQITIPAAATTATLTFWQRGYYSTYYVYHGIWITSGSNPDPTVSSYSEIWSGNAGSTWAEQSLNLTAYAGQTVYLAFRYEGDFADEWYIDDVMISITAPGGCSMDGCTPAVSTPPPIPDGEGGSNPVLASKITSDGSQVSVSWDDLCVPINTNLLYGPLPTVSGHALTGAVCAIDGSGNPYTWNIGDSNLWFVLVSDDDAGTESSWGKISAGPERYGTSSSSYCGCALKDPAASCP